MKDRILATIHGQFALGVWGGRNASGIQPVGDKLLVLVDVALEKTRGGVIITEQSAEAQTLSSTTGIVVAMGDQAFARDSDRLMEWAGRAPEVGERVYFQRYAGQEYTGLDGKMYRVMQDRSVAAIEEVPAAE
ncbi:MAG TPA: hypothetical protein VMV33_17190 [Rhodocyclaceae bacterium]|nr:hypothetical protein [Rhodocyclaceae bacterium]